MQNDRELKTLQVKKAKKKGTRTSNLVTHGSTNLARCGLTSVIEREPVLSTWYGPSWKLCDVTENI